MATRSSSTARSSRDRPSRPRISRSNSSRYRARYPEPGHFLAPPPPGPQHGAVPESVLRWSRRLALAALIAVAFAVVPWQVYRSDGFVRHRRLAGEATELRDANERLRL